MVFDVSTSSTVSLTMETAELLVELLQPTILRAT